MPDVVRLLWMRVEKESNTAKRGGTTLAVYCNAYC